MNPKQLFLDNGRPIEPHLCGSCGRIWESKESAERCCKCSYCGKPCDWLKSTSHSACQDEAYRESERKQLEKATLVPDYDGPFLWGDHVYMDAEEFLEYMDDPDSIPEFGFCTEYHAPALDIENLMANLSEDMHPDWEPEDAPELEAGIAAWNKANENNGTYWEDRTRKWSKNLLLNCGKPAENESVEGARA